MRMDRETDDGQNRNRSGADFDTSSVLKGELEHEFHNYMMGCKGGRDEGESEDVNEGGRFRNEWDPEEEAGKKEEGEAPELEEEADNERWVMRKGVKKEAKKIGAKRSASPQAPVVRRRAPIIIHTYSPKVIQAEKWNFKWVVQSLTGSQDTRAECSLRPPSAPWPSLTPSSSAGFFASTDLQCLQHPAYAVEFHHHPPSERISNPIFQLPPSNLNLNPVHDLFHPAPDPPDPFLNYAHFSFNHI